MNGVVRQFSEILLHPEAAGRASRLPHLSWPEIVMAHVLFGILHYFTLRFGLFLTPQFAEILDDISSSFDEQTANVMRATINQLINSPIQLSILAVVGSFLGGLVFWVVGRNFLALTHIELQGAYLRFQFLRRVLGLVVALVSYPFVDAPSLSSLLGVISFAVSVWLFGAYILFIKGVFELQTASRAFLLFILTLLAWVGLFYAVGLFLTPILFLG